MFAQLLQGPSLSESNQIIRPTSMIMAINTVSAAQRLVSTGSGFTTSNEVTPTIAGGIAAKLAVALMASLVNCFESLSSKDVTTIFELYEATPCVAMMADAVKVPKALDSVAKQ